MSRISAVCLSDLHFGFKGSVLTGVGPDLKTDTKRVSPLLVSLAECLKTVLRDHEGDAKPRLVLAGDVLELALVTTNVAATVFAQFIDLLFDNTETPLDRTVVYLPGNHDHHLWELARENQYTQYLEEDGTNLPFVNVPWHATHLFPWSGELGVKNRDVGSLLLDTVTSKCSTRANVRFLVMYPNLGVVSTDWRRCTIIHHGHFTESTYHLMTDLRGIVFPERTTPRRSGTSRRRITAGSISYGVRWAGRPASAKMSDWSMICSRPWRANPVSSGGWPGTFRKSLTTRSGSG